MGRQASWWRVGSTQKSTLALQERARKPAPEVRGSVAAQGLSQVKPSRPLLTSSAFPRHLPTPPRGGPAFGGVSAWAEAGALTCTELHVTLPAGMPQGRILATQTPTHSPGRISRNCRLRGKEDRDLSSVPGVTQTGVEWAGEKLRSQWHLIESTQSVQTHHLLLK